MLVLVRIDGLCIGQGIIRPLIGVGEKRGSTTVLMLVLVAGGRYGIGAEHILATLGVGFATRVELVQVQNDMREVLDRAIIKVITRLRIRKTGRGIALKGGNGSGTRAGDLLIGK